MKPKNLWFAVIVILFLGSLFSLFSFSQGMHTWRLIGLYSLAFGTYFVIISKLHHVRPGIIWFITIIAYIFAFMQLPYLSNDYFRFLWDGEMIHAHINPFDFTPYQVLQFKTFDSCYFLDLYAGMGELSQQNYSCYPTVNQWFFYAATWFSDDLMTNVLLLRLLFLGSLVFGMYHAQALLRHFHFPKERLFFLLLNPLLILESMGNLHFELVMVSFLLAALHLLVKKKILFSALLFAAAVHIKLIPLLFLPFILPFLGWKLALRYYIIAGLIVFLLFLPFLNLSNAPNFIQSIQLYFGQFEFNSILLFPYLLFGKWKYGWIMTYKFAPQLAKISTTLILGVAWNKTQIDALEMLKRMFWGVMIYCLFTATMHPWYWILPLTFVVFHFSWAILLATFLTFFSYGYYEFQGFNAYRMSIGVLNLGILALFVWEALQPHRFLKWKPKIFS